MAAKRICADCGRKLTTKDFETKMVIYSTWTQKYWCPKCTLGAIRR